MARRRSIAELKRALKRRLMRADQYQVSRAAMDLRAFALTTAFFNGDSMEGIAMHHPLAQAMDRGTIERIVRNNSARRR